ncbi:MAG: hypothetical protein V4519_01885 [Patescibacteria group bacterium]
MPTNLVTPELVEATQHGNVVKVSWEPVPDADYYIVTRTGQASDRPTPPLPNRQITGTKFTDKVNKLLSKEDPEVTYKVQAWQYADPAATPPRPDDTIVGGPASSDPVELQTWWQRNLRWFIIIGAVLLAVILYMLITAGIDWWNAKKAPSNDTPPVNVVPAAPVPTQPSEWKEYLKLRSEIEMEGTKPGNPMTHKEYVDAGDKKVDDKVGALGSRVDKVADDVKLVKDKIGGTPSDPDPTAPRIKSGRPTSRPATGPGSVPPGSPTPTGTPDRGEDKPKPKAKTPPLLAVAPPPKPSEMPVVYHEGLPYDQWQILFRETEAGRPTLIDKNQLKEVRMSNLHPDHVPAVASISGLPDGAHIVLRAEPHVRGLTIPYGGSAMVVTLTDKVVDDFQRRSSKKWVALTFKNGSQLTPFEASVMTFGNAPKEMFEVAPPTSGPTGPGASVSPVPTTPAPADGTTVPSAEPSVAATTNPTRTVTPPPAMASTRSTGSGAVFIGEPRRIAPVTTAPDGKSIDVDESKFVSDVVHIEPRGQRVFYRNRLHESGDHPVNLLGVAMFDSRYNLRELVPIVDAHGQYLGRSTRGEIFEFPEHTMYRDPNQPPGSGWINVPGKVRVIENVK